MKTIVLSLILASAPPAFAVDFSSPIIPDETRLIDIHGEVLFEFTRNVTIPLGGRYFPVLPDGQFFHIGCALEVANVNRIAKIARGTAFFGTDYGDGNPWVELIRPGWRDLTFGGRTVDRTSGDGSDYLQIVCDTYGPTEFLQTTTVGEFRRGLNYAFFLRGEVILPSVHVVR